MSIFTINGNPVKYGNKWLANNGTPSSELPPYDSTDAGKALVVNDDGDGVEWQDVGSSGVVDQHYDPTSSNAQSGTAVAEALQTVPDELPPITGNENKVLKVNADATGVEWATGGSGTQVQSDWTEDDPLEPSYIEHKPTTKPIQAGTGISVVEYADNIRISGTIDAQVQSNWAESDSSNKSYIQNKPTTKQIVAGTNVSIAESQGVITISSTGAGGVPVQADWTQSDPAMPDYIQNKPNLPAPQVQSNWAETNTSSKSFIINKPTTKSIVAGNGINITETATEIIISLA